MSFVPLAFSSLTLVSTGLGGMAAVRFRDRLHLLLGFSSGAVLGVALFGSLAGQANAFVAGTHWSLIISACLLFAAGAAIWFGASMKDS